MLFTTLGRIAATLIFLFGVSRIVIGFSVAGSEELAANAARYLGSSTTGEAIDGGFLMILIALSLGVLTDISRNVQSQKTAEADD